MEKYGALAAQTGEHLAKSGYDVVYGGSRSGLMGLVADSALKAGAKVYGVIPEFLINREIMHTDVSENFITQTMHERQMKMNELSDAFVILPGGMGTMAEFYEIATWKILDIHKKPIIVVNYNGFWDPLLATIDRFREEGFLHGSINNIYEVTDRVDLIGSLLDSAASDT
jgi:uncharacterized protein (TIGR00730 family)